jgi:hypothetical protein
MDMDEMEAMMGEEMMGDDMEAMMSDKGSVKSSKSAKTADESEAPKTKTLQDIALEEEGCLCCCCICHCSTKETVDLKCCSCFAIKCGVYVIAILTIALFSLLFL